MKKSESHLLNYKTDYCEGVRGTQQILECQCLLCSHSGPVSKKFTFSRDDVDPSLQRQWPQALQSIKKGGETERRKSTRKVLSGSSRLQSLVCMAGRVRGECSPASLGGRETTTQITQGFQRRGDRPVTVKAATGRVTSVLPPFLFVLCSSVAEVTRTTKQHTRPV